jgi:hypothetical protein
MKRAAWGAIVLLVFAAGYGEAAIFNGVGDNETDQYGYYYAINGGLFPTGNVPNGDNASGGTFRFLTDDMAWGQPIDVWQKDDWYQQNGSLALTLKNGATTVYDNNGLEDGSFPSGYYTYGPNFPTVGAGAVTAYSMSNNWDWIYAGYFKLDSTTTVTQLTGYFAYSADPNDPLTGGFNPNDPAIAYHMNIFSNVAGDLLPVNTGSFAGNVFSSDTTPGTFSWSDTGYDRTGSASQQDIYRLTYTLDQSITLEPGVYWFSHDASIIPEPASIIIWSLFGLGTVFGVRVWRRRQRAA